MPFACCSQVSVEPFANLTIALIRYRLFGPDRFKCTTPQLLSETHSLPQQLAARCRVVRQVQDAAQGRSTEQTGHEVDSEDMSAGDHKKSVCNNRQYSVDDGNREISETVESNESITVHRADMNNVGTILDVMA